MVLTGLGYLAAADPTAYAAAAQAQCLQALEQADSMSIAVRAWFLCVREWAELHRGGRLQPDCVADPAHAGPGRKRTSEQSGIGTHQSGLAVRAPLTEAVADIPIPPPFPVRVLASQGSPVVATGTVTPNAQLTQLGWNKPLPAGTYQVCVQPPAGLRFTDKSTGLRRGWTCVVAYIAPGSQTQVTFHLTS